MYKAYAELAAKVEGSTLASFKEYEEERQVVRKTYLDTCPDTPAKMEVYLCVCICTGTKIPILQDVPRHLPSHACQDGGICVCVYI